MKNALLIDFGSTFTKVTIVDIERETILAIAQSPTTIYTDIMIGLNNALEQIQSLISFPIDDCILKLACSSAAGGLKMIAIGLVPEITVEAARMAALGAGAKILKTYSFKLNDAEIYEIEDLKPEIILLSGGTDGGDSETIMHNAARLAESRITAPVVMSGNKVVQGHVSRLLKAKGKEVITTDNVLPRLNKIDIKPAQNIIRDIFMNRIVKAKGLGKAECFVDRVVMPTPAAVLQAAILLSEGIQAEEGLGDLIILDPGGATTDIHSITSGYSSNSDIQIKGLPEPYAKRTVEGDLGMRYSVLSMFDAINPLRIMQNMTKPCSFIALEKKIHELDENPSLLPNSDFAKDIDIALARTAIDVAVERHAGVLKKFYGPMGPTYVQYGKDLSNINYVIGTGGALVKSTNPRQIMEGCLQTNPESLKPKNPNFLLDKNYIMSAMGLLSTEYPLAALRIMKKYFIPI